MRRVAADYLLPADPVDRSRFYIPEHITPLHYSARFRALPWEKRLAYNQTHALYFNELVLFFEDVLAETVLGALLEGALPPALAARLEAFRWEEARHAEMFRALNRACAPDLYARTDFHFLRLPPGGRAAFLAAARRPGLFPMFFWLMILQEDRSVYYSKEILRERDALEPHFVAAHKIHMADEAGHVKADEELLARYWAGAPAPLRRANAALLRWILGEFFNTPKRAGWRVVEWWARGFKDEAARLAEWRAELRALEHSEGYHAALYSRESAPAAFAGFDRWPELAGLGSALRAYRPS